MAIMLPDGKWFGTYGPYYSDGHHKDELIWNILSDESSEEFQNKELPDERQQLHATFLKKDIFAAYRGFTRYKGEWSLYTPYSICRRNSTVNDKHQSNQVCHPCS